MKPFTFKSFLYFHLLSFFVLSMVVVSCKKKNSDATPAVADSTVTAEPNQHKQQSADEQGVSSESDDAVSLADSVITAMGAQFNGGRTAAPSLCGGTIIPDSSHKSFVIRFDSSSRCDGKVRSGSISVALTSGTKWSAAGATVTVTFNNYTVTRIADSLSHSWTFNGYHTITNVNGGRVHDLSAVQPQVVHKIRGLMSVSFDGGSVKRSWDIARLRTYDRVGPLQYTCTVAGDTTVAGVSGYSVIGANRYGDAFSVRITSPIVKTNICRWFRTRSGEKVFSGLKHSLTVTFGTDYLGNILPASQTCAFFYKVTWTGSDGNVKTKVLAY